MDKPKIAGKTPAVLDLKAGKHAFCACGASAGQPFCDGSHAGTSFSPQIFELAEDKKVALCNCKQSGNQPYCDGTHAGLE
jgi:CDGSH-type Zn-finger protein